MRRPRRTSERGGMTLYMKVLFSKGWWDRDWQSRANLGKFSYYIRFALVNRDYQNMPNDFTYLLKTVTLKAYRKIDDPDFLNNL